ncbi:hypothetical protein GUJ93_ZPchr0012g18960 [Zizania palustris]|uniref:Uncharacterized protein n=1 Tax=Zizania palustris TaxID=103762 RepID=A0A8J6BZS3_ZIZPA|nr:hypothetical protein GUJ93_ZPchr0012g18960 [Zizania palustris]
MSERRGGFGFTKRGTRDVVELGRALRVGEELPIAPADNMVQAGLRHGRCSSRQLRHVEAALHAVAEWVRGWLEKLGFAWVACA